MVKAEKRGRASAEDGAVGEAGAEGMGAAVWYLIKGADRKSGEPRSARVEASGEEEALAEAGKRGMVVEALEPLPDQPASTDRSAELLAKVPWGAALDVVVGAVIVALALMQIIAGFSDVTDATSAYGSLNFQTDNAIGETANRLGRLIREAEKANGMLRILIGLVLLQFVSSLRLRWALRRAVERGA